MTKDRIEDRDQIDAKDRERYLRHKISRNSQAVDGLIECTRSALGEVCDLANNLGASAEVWLKTIDALLARAKTARKTKRAQV